MQSHGYEFQFAEPDDILPSAEEQWRATRDPNSGNVHSQRQVSSLGWVKTVTGNINRGAQARSGYYSTSVNFEGHTRRYLIHRLVAAAFLGPPPCTHRWEVHHKDSNPANNHASNLEYVTRSQNIKYSYAVNPSRGRKDTVAKAVLARKINAPPNSDWTRHRSINDAARSLGLDSSRVSKCCKGITSQVGQYEFRFAAALVPKILPGEHWRSVTLEDLMHIKHSGQRRH